MICTGCCNTLDHIVTYVFRQLTAKGKKARKVVEQQQGAQLIRLMEIRPELLQQMLSCILNIVMFEECRNQYSMSRPLLGLILLNEDYFGQLRQSIIRSQPVDKQSLMAQWFDNLMDGIERNVTAKNRDRYVGFDFFFIIVGHFTYVSLPLQIYTKPFTIPARCERIVKRARQQPTNFQQRYDDLATSYVMASVSCSFLRDGCNNFPSSIRFHTRYSFIECIQVY